MDRVEGRSLVSSENKQTEPIFVRLSEAARLLSMSRSAAYEAMKAGAIPAVRIAGKWRVPRAALERLVAEAMKPTAGSDTESVARSRVEKRRTGNVKTKTPSSPDQAL